MLRRILLAATFVAALGAAGFVATDSADAHGRGRGYRGAYYNAYYPPAYGYYPHVYRSSYYPPAFYGPPAYYGRSYYRGGPGCYDRGGVYFSVGF